ncbi:hypothetical protein VIBNIAM115_540015 [Vibrio nigripulchritudo AM115]|nr:hypothetical protein VIBNIAM115_540015 [Vibrio nigripulchritudo AM115]
MLLINKNFHSLNKNTYYEKSIEVGDTASRIHNNFTEPLIK